MAIEVKVADWAEKSEAQEAAISAWLKNPGAEVKQGDLLAELTVEKVNLPVEAPTGGVLLEIKAGVGQTVLPGSVVALVGSQDEWLLHQHRTTAIPFEPIPPKTMPTETQTATVTQNEPAMAVSEIVASPVAKRLMREKGVTIEQVIAFVGPGVRRIGEEEVHRFLMAQARPTPATPPASRLVPYAGIRQATGERMSRSLRETAQLTISCEADLTDLVELKQTQPQIEARPGITALLGRAVCLALPQHPYLNACLEGQNIHFNEEINLGVAVQTDKGLLVPVIKQAGAKNSWQLQEELIQLAQLAREGQLSLENSQAGTFTITNLGAWMVDVFTPIINPPQAAILGMGRILARPWVVDGQVVPRQVAWLSLTFDHRIIDGAGAAEFLASVKNNLEAPEALF